MPLASWLIRRLHAGIELTIFRCDDSGRNPNYDRLTITSQGFQFLLEDRQTQLWQILMFYLARKQRRGEGAADILSLFFSLGCMQLGQDYSASKSFQNFPEGHQCLDDLEQYGFIYRRHEVDGRKTDQFFPTHLATSLCSGDTSVNRSATADDKRFLILETNYRVYAYTSNELEIAILNLFVNITIRYPNMIVGHLDRRHVKAAMDKGISAHQIIAYLTTHAHPQMYNHPPPLLHPSVTDQMHLWDRERNRVQAQDSGFYQLSTTRAQADLQLSCSSSTRRSSSRRVATKRSEWGPCSIQYSEARVLRSSSSWTPPSESRSETSSRRRSSNCGKACKTRPFSGIPVSQLRVPRPIQPMYVICIYLNQTRRLGDSMPAWEAWGFRST